MKKLMIACLVLLLIGSGLAIGGAAAGGRLYGSYYDGSLHPITDSISDALDAVDRFSDHNLFRRGLHYESGYAADGSYHSGWFDDRHGLDDFDNLPDEMKDDLSYLPDPDIRELEFAFGAGAFRIQQGDEFAVTGGVVQDSLMNDDTWELSVRGRTGDGKVVITLPEAAYDKIEFSIGAATLEIETPLAARKAEIAVGMGILSVKEALNVDKLELDCGAGSATVLLAGSAGDYGYEIAASAGSVTLDGTELAGGGPFGTHRASKNGTRELELSVGAGTIELTTAGTV